MSALDFLARATAALSAALSKEEGATRLWLDGAPPSQSVLARVKRRLREEGLPVRRVLWPAGAGRTRSEAAWKAEWLESRWPVPATGPELVGVVGVSPAANAPSLCWWVRLVRAFHGLVAHEGDGAFASRSVRFLLVPGGDTAVDRPYASLRDPARLHVISVACASDGTVRLEADGFLAALVGYFSQRAGVGEPRWVAPTGTVEIACRGPEAGTGALRLLLSAGLWWRRADLSSLYPLLSWAVPWLADACLREAEAHPLRRWASTEAVASYVLEARLKEFRRLAHIFSQAPGAEEEAAGWSREIEAEMRRRWALGCGARPSPVGLHPSTHTVWDRPVPPWLGETGVDPADAASPYVPRSHFGARLAGEAGFAGRDERRLGGSGRLLRHGMALADGERALVEVVLRIAVECGVAWEQAAETVGRWLREGWLVPHRRRLESRTLLYFSYGSCMCRPSFRETVPHFELLGEAVLRDHRLAFTRRSAGRGGGVADLVPEPGGEVRGVLYRIPRVFLSDLDEREGVFTGHYRRMWVAVEALGVTFDDVLTYTVVHKAPREIAPSPEYAGLILDGARGLLADAYVQGLEALFETWGVEPEIPL